MSDNEKYVLTEFDLYGKNFKILRAHVSGLILSIIGWILGWYSLVLITASVKNGEAIKANGWFIEPTNIQNLGIIFAVLMGIVTWFQRIAAIQGDTTEQGK